MKEDGQEAGSLSEKEALGSGKQCPMLIGWWLTRHLVV